MSDFRLVVGRSWFNEPRFSCRASCNKFTPDYRCVILGLRLVRGRG